MVPGDLSAVNLLSLRRGKMSQSTVAEKQANAVMALALGVIVFLVAGAALIVSSSELTTDFQNPRHKDYQIPVIQP